MNKDKRYIVELREDVATGNLILPIPEELLHDLGWYEGTTLEFNAEGQDLIVTEVTLWLQTLFITFT